MKLGVVAALQTELGPVLRALRPSPRRVEHLTFHETPSLVFTAGGVGARPAAAAALLMADHAKPDALVSLGFCGALTDDLQAPDLVLGGTTAHPATPALLDLARTSAPNAKSGAVHTVPKVLVKADEKRALAKSSGAAVVDMEADAVGVVARARNLGFLCVKVVIDTPSEPLASTYAGCWTVFRDIVTRPGTIGQMIYDSKRVKVAAERLRDFFVVLKAGLPAS